MGAKQKRKTPSKSVETDESITETFSPVSVGTKDEVESSIYCFKPVSQLSSFVENLFVLKYFNAEYYYMCINKQE